MSDENEQTRRYAMRHSAAHVMAEAVLKIFPEGKLATSLSVEGGFYYDFDLPRTLTFDDLIAIGTLMRERTAMKLPFEYCVVSDDEARTLFEDQPYKLELIDEMAARSEVIGICRHADFIDLCRGPHVHDTSEIGTFRIIGVGDACWRNDAHRPALQRIYATDSPA